jgi:hypothetical protein
VLSLMGGAAAQTFGIALSALPGDTFSLEPELQVRDLELSPVTLDLRLAKSLPGEFEFGLAGRFRSSFGPLGTVAVGAQADLDTAGGFDIGVTGSGALASTGLDASLSVFNRNPGTFSAPNAYTPPRPFFDPSSLGAGVGTHLALGVTQRLGRTVILEALPTVSYLSGTGLGAGLEARLQFRRLVGRDNGVLLLAASTGPGSSRDFVAAGAEYQLNRRGLPSLSTALLLGRGSAGLLPGVRLNALGELSAFSYRAELAAEPYRPDTLPYRGSVALGTDLGEGALGIELGAALANPYVVPPLMLRASYGIRF